MNTELGNTEQLWAGATLCCGAEAPGMEGILRRLGATISTTSTAGGATTLLPPTTALWHSFCPREEEGNKEEELSISA